MNCDKEQLLSFLPKKIKDKLQSGNKRSKDAIINIIISFGCKFFTMATSLLLVPMTIHYINPTQYGIWLTLSSIIGWIGFFDLGLGNGFRKKYAEAKANADIETAKNYVSTTYATISIIVAVIYCVVLVVNHYIDWAEFLNVDSSYRTELHNVFFIIITFFCLNMVANLITTLLTADQKPGVASVMGVLGQLLSLFSIYILTKLTRGSLTNLALYYSGIPTLVLVFASFYTYTFTSYRNIRPAITSVNFGMVRSILSLGVQFFAISLCGIVLFQIINIVLSREVGPEAVTEYNVAYRLFNVIFMITIIFVTPFWSAFTDAYTKKDFNWMKNVLYKLERTWLVFCLLGIIMLLASPLLYRLWIGDSVSIPFLLSAEVLLYMLFQSIGAIYMNLINGIGYVRIQLIIYVLTALISYPALLISCRFFGVSGALLLPTTVFFLQALFGRIQLRKILNNTAKGLWIR